MIVCHCEVVNDRTITACAAAGHTTREAVTAVCGAGSDCGECHETIEALIAETVTAVSLQSAAA